MGRFTKSQTSDTTGEETLGFSFHNLNLNAHNRKYFDKPVPRSEGGEKRQKLSEYFCSLQLDERAKKREHKRTNRNKRTNQVESCKRKKKVHHDERQKKCWFNPITELAIIPLEQWDKKRYWSVLYPPIHPLDDDFIAEDKFNLWQQDPELDEWEH